MQYSAVQCSAVQYSAVQFSVIFCSIIQHISVQSSSMQYATVRSRFEHQIQIYRATRFSLPSVGWEKFQTSLDYSQYWEYSYYSITVSFFGENISSLGFAFVDKPNPSGPIFETYNVVIFLCGLNLVNMCRIKGPLLKCRYYKGIETQKNGFKILRISLHYTIYVFHSVQTLITRYNQICLQAKLTLTTPIVE